MAGLYLNCGLCGRRQADGLLSRGYWGHLQHETGELHACPTCKQSSGWETRLVGGSTSVESNAAYDRASGF